MRLPIAPRPALIAIYLAAAAALAAGTGWISFGAALDRLAARGAADLALAADNLQGDLARYATVASIVSDEPGVLARLRGAPAPGVEARLQEVADKSGLRAMTLLDRTGVVRAAVGEGAGRTPAAFERALDGALGLSHRVEPSGRRVFSYAAPVFGPGGGVLGALVATVDVETVESNWRGDRPTIFFTDALGVVFISNRSELVLRARGGDVSAAAQSLAYPAGQVAPFRAVEVVRRGPHAIWKLDGTRYLPDRGLHLSLPLPVVGLTGEALLDTGPARRLALLQATVAGALALLLGGILLFAAERRRTLALANARLETRVAERTRALRDLNDSLQREVTDRREAEARLKRAQSDLVQAAKLSALGQMSAGISHELNQPLMALRSFSENAEAFLARNKPEAAAQNLRRISDMAHRMGRIIRNLRAFARQESEALRDVDIGAVVDRALEIAGPRLRQDGVTLRWKPPASPILVRGGEVRLQQVMLNLITNAADAMAGNAERALFLAVDREGGRVCVTVRDTGPGLADPDKVFEPFYSTKEVQDENGMGLGLSISYGLVESFGGHIRGRNAPDGGAVFTVTLDAGRERAAA